MQTMDIVAPADELAAHCPKATDRQVPTMALVGRFESRTEQLRDRVALRDLGQGVLHRTPVLDCVQLDDTRVELQLLQQSLQLATVLDRAKQTDRLGDPIRPAPMRYHVQGSTSSRT